MIYYRIQQCQWNIERWRNKLLRRLALPMETEGRRSAIRGARQLLDQYRAELAWLEGLREERESRKERAA